MGKDTENLENG